MKRWVNCLLLCAFLLGLDWLQMQRIQSQLAWTREPSVPGRMTACSGYRKGYGRSASWVESVAYAYTVDGKDYRNNRYRYGVGDWDEFAAQHSVGTPVTVYYRPGDPQDSLVNPGIQGSDWLPVALLVPLHLWAFLIVWRVSRMAAVPSPFYGLEVYRKGDVLRVPAVPEGGAWISAMVSYILFPFAAIPWLVHFGANPRPAAVGLLIALEIGWVVGAWKLLTLVFDPHSEEYERQEVRVDLRDRTLSCCPMVATEPSQPVAWQSRQQVPGSELSGIGVVRPPLDSRSTPFVWVVADRKAGGTVRLLDCKSAADGDGWATWLATHLGVPKKPTVFYDPPVAPKSGPEESWSL